MVLNINERENGKKNRNEKKKYVFNFALVVGDYVS